MFRGEYEYNLDDKGRMLIPAKCREELGEFVVLSRGGDGQINIYPKAFFEAMEQSLAAHGDSESFRQASRFLAAATECEVDRQGRIMIPGVLRRHAGLEGAVVIVGNRTHLELWNPTHWQQVYQSWVADFSSNKDDYAKMREAGLRM